MIRYLKLWLLFARFSLIREMQYKGNFLSQITVEIFWAIATIFFLEIFFYQTNSVASWSKPEMYFLYGFFRLTSSVGAIIYRKNIQRISHLVNSGEFDMILLKPISSLYLFSVREVGFNRISQVAISFLILAYATNQLNFSWTLPTIVLISSLAVATIFTRYSLAMIINLPVFWWERINNMYRIEFSLMSMARYPRQAFPRFFREFFTILIPTLMVAAVPSEIILGKSSLWLVFLVFGFSAALFFLTIKTYSWALRHYSSASS